ncbi:MAG TPA: c(7)-type cytochrome triheme domain-containing protein [Steroidobacteraceae bacterium]
MSRFGRKSAFVVVALTCLVLMLGCNSGNPLLADLLVPLPPTAPVKNLPRHPPPPKVVPIVIVQEEVIKPPEIDWSGIYAALPRDGKGNVDWMRTLDEQLITPKPGIDPDAAPASTTDSEIVFTPADNPGKSATFRHATHTQWLSCKNCHSGIFKKRDENLQFTHDDMEQGKKYCGACHFTVVVVPSGCKGCHAGKKPAAKPAEAATT